MGKEGELRFSRGFDKLELAKGRLDESVAKLLRAYTEVADKKHDLELAYHDAAYVQLAHCKALVDRLGIYAECQDHYRAALEAYREQQSPPQCAVGASLRLAPAALGSASAVVAAAILRLVDDAP